MLYSSLASEGNKMSQAAVKSGFAVRTVLSATLLASSVLAPAAKTVGLPTRAQLKACPAFADVDFRAIARDSGAARPDWRTEMDRRHARTRGPYARFGAHGDARITLRIWAGPGETQEYQTETSSLVWLGADGVWRLDRVDHVLNRPPSPKPPSPPNANGVGPPPVGWTQEELELLSRARSTGMIRPDQAYGIESTLADPCFALQPNSMPFEVPVRKGKEPRAPCWGLIGGTLEIAWADGRRRDVTELCGGFYANGIINAVMYARPMVEDDETKAVCDRLRSLAEPSGADARELAFCRAGLTAELRKKALNEERRQALYADAATMTPLEMMKRHHFLSLWSAGALKKAVAAAGR